MKSVPHFLRVPYRSAMRLAMEEATQSNPVRSERGWRLFLLLPRLLLFRPPRGGNIHKNKLGERFQAFAEGQWSHLLSQSRQCAEDASVAMHRKRRRHSPQQDLDRRALRAEGLVQMGELSAGRQALEGASLAPGNRQTLDALQDPQRRPPEPRDPIPRLVLDFVPEVPFDLDETKFASNVRSARRGAAAGPSGMTVEHIRLVLDNVRDAHLLFSMAEQLVVSCPRSTFCHRCPQIGEDDRLPKTQWRRVRHRGGRCPQEVGGQDSCPTNGEGSGGSNASTPECHVHEGRDGMHRPCAPGPH